MLTLLCAGVTVTLLYSTLSLGPCMEGRGEEAKLQQFTLAMSYTKSDIHA